MPHGTEGAVNSYIESSKGIRVEEKQSGSSISKSIEEWLALADISLDTQNTQLTPDYRNASKYPTFRKWQAGEAPTPRQHPRTPAAAPAATMLLPPQSSPAAGVQAASVVATSWRLQHNGF